MSISFRPIKLGVIGYKNYTIIITASGLSFIEIISIYYDGFGSSVSLFGTDPELTLLSLALSVVVVVVFEFDAPAPWGSVRAAAGVTTGGGGLFLAALFSACGL